MPSLQSLLVMNLENNKIDVKNMTTGESETIELDALVEYFKNEGVKI